VYVVTVSVAAAAIGAVVPAWVGWFVPVAGLLIVAGVGLFVGIEWQRAGTEPAVRRYLPKMALVLLLAFAYQSYGNAGFRGLAGYLKVVCVIVVVFLAAFYAGRAAAQRVRR
jgi:hypothetical protein